MCLLTAAATAMLLLPADGDVKNPWKDRVRPAEQAALRERTPKAFADALDAAWRGDDWETGLRLALAARELAPQHRDLTGYVCRALWRAGRLLDAEALVGDIPSDTVDRAALHTLATIHMARGEFEAARACATRLGRQERLSAADLGLIMSVRLELADTNDLHRLIRDMLKSVDPANGYPETFMLEVSQGLPELFEKLAGRKLNELRRHGEAPMPLIPVILLPGCDVWINGRGPYRMVLDTGGSVSLSLDSGLAEELGLERIADAAVHGVGGKDTAWQTIVPELRVGSIAVQNVMTRAFAVRRSTAFACDGIIGTGIFADARMTLDFESARLVVGPSSDAPGAGDALTVRVIGDAKIMAPVTLHGQPATGLLDSGAGLVAVSPNRLRKLFPGEEVTSLAVGAAGVGAGETSVGFGRPVDLTFGGKHYPSASGVGLDALDGLLSTFLGMQADVLIGVPIFRDMRSFTIDFPKRRAWVRWIEP